VCGDVDDGRGISLSYPRGDDDFIECMPEAELEGADGVFSFSENDDLDDVSPDMMRTIDDFAALDRGEKNLVMDMVKLLLEKSLQ